MRYRADHTVRIKDPEDFSVPIDDAGRLLDAASGATAHFHVFDEDKRTTITAIASGGGPFQVFTVGNAGLYEVGDAVWFVDGAGTDVIDTLTARDTTADTITTTSTVANHPKLGSPVRRVYGPLGAQEIAMAEYGTPKVGSKKWGWKATLSNQSFPELTPGINAYIEAVVIGSGGSLDLVLADCQLVEDDCE